VVAERFSGIVVDSCNHDEELVMGVRVDLNVSLDGYATTDGDTSDNPFGEDWGKLTAAYVGTRTFLERVMHDTSGAGTTGIDDKHGAAYFEGIGAEIMGAGMFGFHTHPDDPDWKGWWGDEPPFRVPVFVLTHRTLDPMEMAGGTTFHFVDATAHQVLALAVAAAGGQDVRVGGGATTVRQFLKHGLVDRLHVAIAPILLGRGINLWEDLRGLENGYRVDTETADSGTVHVTFTRPSA
jgi:dihydrofolate reductase